MTTQTQNPAYRPTPSSVPTAPTMPPTMTLPPRVWAIADPHLGFGVGRNMDRFGPQWTDHPRQIRENADRLVAPGDVLLLPGDLSWATKRADALPDLHFLAVLPGIKVAIKGNHDHWWDSGKPIAFPGLASPPIRWGDTLGIAGTRGWFEPTADAEDPESGASDRKILERERGRLLASLAAIEGCAVKVAMLHYPPHPFLGELREAGVAAVVYGHVHLRSLPEDERLAVGDAVVEGVRICCVAADRIDFTPKRIL